MNNRVKRLFSCCVDNRVAVIDTNFKEFYKTLKKLEPTCNSDRWYSDRFKEHIEFEQRIGEKMYYFQRLV